MAPVRTMWLVAAALLATTPVKAPPAFAQQPRYDVVVAGGTVIDGTGKPGIRADVAIKDGRIVQLGSIGRGQAAETIDARRLVVTPGFIDVHTHADDIASHPA